MHPASHGDNSPASPSGPTPTPADARKGKALASRLRDAIAAFRAADAAVADDRFLTPEELADLRLDLDAARDTLADARAAVDAHAARLDAHAARLDARAAEAPGSPRWTRTAEALRDAADSEGYDFDAYGDDDRDGYSGRGMYGREVPALTLDDRDEAAVVAHAFRKATGVRASVDSLGLGFVVYPDRLVD
jgi:hypothetical protein